MKTIYAFVIVFLVAGCFAPSFATDAESTENMLLVDYGNGSTVWYPLGSEDGTLFDLTHSALKSNNVSVETEGSSFVSVSGVANIDICGQNCVWRFYIWDSYSWTYGDTDGSETFVGGYIALGYYPSESISPVPTPFFKDTWTSYRGDSGYSGISESYGPDNAATPLEWYLQTETGGIYSSILVADGLAYFLAGGDFNGSGVNRNPHLYCVDTVNQEIAWSFGYTIGFSSGSSGYELNTPVIVGDMIILTSSNWHIYCMDRFDGTVLAEMVPEGERAHFADVFNTTHYRYESGSGQISFKGVSTAVYDSGALYFVTSDGVLHAVSITPNGGSAVMKELWRSPESGSGTSTSSPVVTSVNGIPSVVTASSDGIEIFDICTGKRIKTYSLDSGGQNICKIVPADDGRIVITFDDGAMIPRSGGIAVMDLSTGNISWKAQLLPYMHGPPTVVGSVLFAYLEPSDGSTFGWDKNGNQVESTPGYYALSLDDGHIIWHVKSDALTRSGMTYCDERLYCTDYATLAEWPNGGAVRCIDPDTGSILWSVRLEPGSINAYSMCAPTVAGGKIFVGNDDGILYCISDIPGKERGISNDIDYDSQGLAHWSWLMLFSVGIITAAVAIVLYRK